MKPILKFLHFGDVKDFAFAKCILIFPVWENCENKHIFGWWVPTELTGRFYNAFLSGEVIKNAFIDKHNCVQGEIKIYSGCSSEELEKIGF